MKKVPRASLSITILRDEDYRLLMKTADGAEAFGVFVSMVLVARERLQEGKWERVRGSDSLRLNNSATHLACLAQIQDAQFERALDRLAAVAKATGEKPWMYLDKTGCLVIRSFFKFNSEPPAAGWGGPRPNSGRPINENQDENHLGFHTETKSETILVPSSSSSSSSSSESERDAGASQPIEDEDPVRTDEALGPNSAKQVRETLHVVEECFPMDDALWTLARQWLREHPASRVVAAVQTTKQKGANRPGSYAKSLIDDPTFPQARASSPKTVPLSKPPEPERPEYRIHRASPETRAILAEQYKRQGRSA